jgi:peptide/nickel transport system permease protein
VSANVTTDALLGAEINQPPRPKRSPSLRRLVATNMVGLLRRPALVASLLVLAIVLAAALWPQAFTHFSPTRGVGVARLRPPSLEHIFGTDQMGRDLYARVVYGAGQSLTAVVLAVLVGFSSGCVIGLAAGYFGRWADDVLMRLIDVLLAVPTLLISLAIINAMGFGMTNIAIAVGVGSVAGFARVMRSEVLRIKHMSFVEAATFAGVGHLGVLMRHVVPNAAGPVAVLATLELGWAILGVSALSFLGFGPPPPTPEWGLLVAAGREYMGSAWWLTTFPGAVIALTVLAANRAARALDRGSHAY